MTRRVLCLAGLFLAACEPAKYPSGTSCGDVYVGYFCCDDGYPGQCMEGELCYPPDECRQGPGPNDEARPPHKRRL